LWDGVPGVASPSWSYRTVCRAILGSPVSGVSPDDLVLQVLAAAEPFGAARVSFSRSSVSGVPGWLRAQSPPLVRTAGQRIARAFGEVPSATAIRLHLAALAALRGGRVPLDAENLKLLSEPASDLSIAGDERVDGRTPTATSTDDAAAPDPG